ncbi:MAG: hypothetical protein NTZ35_01275 [Ignavibacteriales bacterium]|nr:hypothetical protein [Ignavibacteriales bacterium]
MAQADENNIGSTLKDWLMEVVASKVLTLFEPEKKSIPNVNIGQSRYISGKLGKSRDDSFIKFPQRYGRHTTLAGIWMFLKKDHEKEYLVTAFGKRKGAGTDRPAQFDGIHISHGSEHSVRFSATCLSYLQEHTNRIENAEVMICHNHPKNFISNLVSQIIDWSPLPSNTDRETMYQFRYRGLVRWLASGHFPSLRFFVVENGGLREIQLPPFERISEILNSMTNQTSSINS